MIRLSFSPIEEWRRACISAPVFDAAVVYDLRQRKEFRAHIQARSLRCVGIDQESQVSALQRELKSAACLREAVGLPHHQNWRMLKVLEDSRQMRPLRLADKNHLALPGLCEVLEAFDDHGPAPNALVSEDVVQHASEGIGAQHANYEWRSRVCEAALGPVDELREVVQESRLKLIFGRRRDLRAGRGRKTERRNGHEHYRQELPANQKRMWQRNFHSSAPRLSAALADRQLNRELPVHRRHVSFA